MCLHRSHLTFIVAFADSNFFMHLLSFLGPSPWQRQLATLVAFLLPALALSVASGYSYGAVLLLLGALFSLPRWVTVRPDRATVVLALAMLGMALLWFALSDPRENWGRFDRSLKFALAVPCLLFIAAFPPRARALFWGLLIGCIGVCGVALWQVHVEGAPRASGFPSNRTNAIQWGNLVLLLGAMLAVQTIALYRQLSRAVVAVAVLAVLAALNASMLSQSRGGWLALLLAIPLGLVLFQRLRPGRLFRIFAGILVALSLVTALNWEMVETRWHLMRHEVQVYGAQREADNSVGQRLEHWRYAWDAGREKPLTGWGMAGYMEDKARRVAAGQYQPAIMEYIYAHNEVLDVFVKTGLVGVGMLLIFYGVPIALFWPSRRRLQAMAGLPDPLKAQMVAVRLSGLCIPVLYMGFGLTQVFFAHNSGIMFYLFMNLAVWGALLGLQQLPSGAAQSERAVS